MPGILGVFNHECIASDYKLFNKMKEKNLINDSIQHDNLYIERRTLNKFQNDKFLKENGEYIILIEGVIFNLSSLKLQYGEEDFFELVIKLRTKIGEDFFKIFKGCFSGVIFDKELKTLLLFTDQLGTKAIYFAQYRNNIIFGSEIKYILENLSKNGNSYNLNEEAVYPLLAYRFLLEDNTLIKEIKKLEHGKYLSINGDSIEVKTYCELYEEFNQKYTFYEAIEKIDFLFKNALRLLLEKNKEYGYKNVAPLSAGLDSRTVNYFAKQLSDQEIVNITYSQSEFYDSTIPIKIAGELKNRVYYMNLDNGLSFIKNFLREVEKCEGQYNVGVGMMLFDFLENFNMADVGIVITGVSGDCIVGTSISNIVDNEFKLDKKNLMYTNGFSDELIKKTKLKRVYASEEDFRVNNTDLGNMLAYFETFQIFGEAYSPFLDIDLLKFCYSLPIEYRSGHRLYNKWVALKCPEILKYPRNGVKIKTNNMPIVKIFGHSGRIDQIHTLAWLYFKRRIAKMRHGSYSMNPVDSWYSTNTELKDFFDTYFNENIDLIKNHERLYLKCKEVYENPGIIFENKMPILTFLGFYAVFLSDLDNGSCDSDDLV